MAYQETSRQSYGNKVKGSFQGILWGLILIIAGTVILWWNEGRAVKASDALKDFQKNYVEMPDINTVNPEFEGKAVHAMGVAKTDDILRDDAFGIAVNAFSLTREAEYYQWTEQSSSESKDKLGGATETTTTYTYEPAWCDEPVNSAEFKDPDYKGKNFVLRVIENNDQQAANATFGAYKLTDGIIGSISGAEPVTPVLTEEQIKQLLAKVSDSTVVVSIRGNQVYIGADPDTPHIGDVRITFNQVTSPKSISILQKVVNGTFESYIAKNGKSFSKVEMGTVSAENMIEHQKSANKVWLWVLRIIGVLLVIGGNKGLLGFLSTVMAVVPFIQKIVGAGISLVATVVGIIWSLIVIAIAWVAHRPVLAICLLAVAAAVTVWLVSRARKKKRSDLAILLAFCLMAGLAGCTGSGTNGGGDGETVAPSSFVKGPVQTVKCTETYGEGEPFTTYYRYDEKGNVISEQEEEYDFDDYDIIESLSEKDAEGHYTKMVYGSDGEADQIVLNTYNENGDIVTTDARQVDGTWNYTTRNEYNDEGKLIASFHNNPYSSSVYNHQYDSEGHLVRSTYAANGTLFSITENVYDENGNIPYHKETYPQSNRFNEYYTYYDEEGETIANRTYVTDENGRYLQYSDTLYHDSKGLRHNRNYNFFDNTGHTSEGTFNKEGNLVHFEFFEGTANNPSYVIDFDFEKDGKTLKEVVWKDMSLGSVTDTRTRSFATRYDTFGNWTRRTSGIPYLFDGSYTNFDSIENMLPETTREITYRGEDQGQNYGFEGKAGKATIQLTCTEDNDVFFGSLAIDGNIWRAVGTRDKNDNLFFEAITEDGDVPWSLSIPAGSGKRAATLFDGHNGSETELTLTPIRKGLQTYSFSTTSDDLVGLYEYHFRNLQADGTLDVSRCGEDWENIQFNIENIWNSTFPKIASDEQTDYLGDRTDFYVYKWEEGIDGSLEYTVRFFDGFAVIIIRSGQPGNFFPNGTTIAGIYAKLPSVG